MARQLAFGASNGGMLINGFPFERGKKIMFHEAELAEQHSREGFELACKGFGTTKGRKTLVIHGDF